MKLTLIQAERFLEKAQQDGIATFSSEHCVTTGEHLAKVEKNAAYLNSPFWVVNRQYSENPLNLSIKNADEFVAANIPAEYLLWTNTEFDTNKKFFVDQIKNK